MTNQEITNKLIEVDNIADFCDKIMTLKNFEKEYKASDFYKCTKIDIFDLYRNYSFDRIRKVDDVFGSIQKHINELNLDKLSELLNVFMQNEEFEIDELKNSMNGIADIVRQWGNN